MDPCTLLELFEPRGRFLLVLGERWPRTNCGVRSSVKAMVHCKVALGAHRHRLTFVGRLLLIITWAQGISVLLDCGQVDVCAPNTGSLNRLDAITFFLIMAKGYGVIRWVEHCWFHPGHESLAQSLVIFVIIASLLMHIDAFEADSSFVCVFDATEVGSTIKLFIRGKRLTMRVLQSWSNFSLSWNRSCHFFLILGIYFRLSFRLVPHWPFCIANRCFPFKSFHRWIQPFWDC